MLKFLLLLSALVDQTADTGTLRLTLMDESKKHYFTVLAEDREKTVIKGLASSGGFWTLISGIFATLLGGSFIYNLFGELTTPFVDSSDPHSYQA